MDVKQIERLERVVAALPLPLVANNATELWHGLGPGGRIAACDWEGLPDTLAEAINALPALLQLARAVQSAPRAKLEINLGELMTACLHFAPGQTVALVPVPVKEGA